MCAAMVVVVVAAAVVVVVMVAGGGGGVEAKRRVVQAINPGGREIAVQRGANLMMPILTPIEYRADYQLYANKPCIDEGAAQCRGCLTMRVKTAGKEIAWGEWGDPPHYYGDDAVVRG